MQKSEVNMLLFLEFSIL